MDNKSLIIHYQNGCFVYAALMYTLPHLTHFRGEQKYLFTPYPLDCSLTNLLTNPSMVCKFKFICYGLKKKIQRRYVSAFNFAGTPKSKMSNFQIANCLNSSSTQKFCFDSTFKSLDDLMKPLQMCPQQQFWEQASLATPYGLVIQKGQIVNG